MDPLIQELSDILAPVEDLRKGRILTYIGNCLDPEFPTHEVSLIGLGRSLCLYHSVPERNQQRFEDIIDEIVERMHKRGYREDYLTWQECSLVGGTVSREYREQPYKPMGVITGDLSVAEAQKARALAKRAYALGTYFCLDQWVLISLEPLDETGNTVRDPQLLDDNLKPIPTQYSADFPAIRETQK